MYNKIEKKIKINQFINRKYKKNGVNGFGSRNL